MVIEIWLPFFNDPLNHFYSPLVTKFGLLDYNQGLDKLTKELWMLRWCLKSGCHFLTIQIVFKSFFFINDQILVAGLQSGSRQVDQKIVDVEMTTEIQQPIFNDLDFYLFLHQRPDLGHQTTIRVWIHQPKIMVIKMVTKF